jgi:hypothetical protein
MVSWMIQLHASGQLRALSPRGDASLVAGVFFAGGSYHLRDGVVTISQSSPGLTEMCLPFAMPIRMTSDGASSLTGS